MQGHLKQRGKNGIWYAVFRANGKQKWHRLQAKAKREAEREMTRLLASLDAGTYVETSRLTVEQYLTEKWIPLVASKESAPATLASFTGRLRKYVFPTIGSVPLQKLTGLALQELYTDMMAGKFGKPLQSQTVRVLHVQLHKAFGQAVTWGLIGRNPSDGAKAKRGKAAKKRVLTGEETVQLLDFFRDTDIYVPTLIILCTGLRRGEALGLRWADVDLVKKQLYVQQALSRVEGQTYLRDPKTDSSERYVSIPSVLVEALKQHYESQEKPPWPKDLICIRADGSPLVPTTFSDKFTRYAVRCGLAGATAHGLRHGHASLLHEAGVRDKVISERLGHTGIGMTLDTYTHLSQASQDEAADKVNDLLQRRKGAH